MRQIKFAVAAIALLIAGPTFAQAPAGGGVNFMSAVPNGSVTVMGLYKQNVYDPSDKKIGQVIDILVGKDGKLTAFVIGAGGFVGLARHDVVVLISAVKVAKKQGKDYLIMDATKDELKKAPAFRYDRATMTWIPNDGAQANAQSSEADRKTARKLSGH